MKIDGTQPIAKLAADVPGAIGVFETLGLDYACAGDRSLDDAAHAEGIAPELVLASLRKLTAVEHAESWSERPLVELIRHLEEQHHRFVREELAMIALRLADACTAPLHAPADLMSLRAAFTRLTDIMLPHLHREEEEIFPAILVLENAWAANEASAPAGRELSSGLHRLAGEHGAITAQLRTMRELRLRLEESNDLPPRCTAILHAVATLEAHLHQYMFLENCILFPRAATLDAANARKEVYS